MMSKRSSFMNLQTFSAHYRPLIDEASIQFIESLDLANHLKEAILYSYNAGGKRIRPLLLLSVVHAFDIDLQKAIHTAAALELIHTSSLIHDDLPAMDDDDYRRGKLTNHKVFGEATAILAGDALLVNAFEMITRDPLLTDYQKVQLIRELAACSGANGMIGGQQLDIENEQLPITLEELMTIHEHKTGKLLQFALLAGGIISNQTEAVLNRLKNAAYHIGIAFQIKDDLLDVCGDAEVIGKPINSDEKNHKTTYVTLLGLEESNQKCEMHYQKAIDIIHELKMNDSILEELFKLIIKRNK